MCNIITDTTILKEKAENIIKTLCQSDNLREMNKLPKIAQK